MPAPNIPYPADLVIDPETGEVIVPVGGGGAPPPPSRAPSPPAPEQSPPSGGKGPDVTKPEYPEKAGPFSRQEWQQAGLKTPPSDAEMRGYGAWYLNTRDGRMLALRDIARARAATRGYTRAELARAPEAAQPPVITEEMRRQARKEPDYTLRRSPLGQKKYKARQEAIRRGILPPSGKAVSEPSTYKPKKQAEGKKAMSEEELAAYEKWGREFITKAKARRKDIDKLKESYNGDPIEAVRGGDLALVKRIYAPIDVISIQTMAAELPLTKKRGEAIFTEDAYKAYQTSSPEKKFDTLVKMGVIPQGSKYAGLDDKGNPTYYSPAPIPDYPDLAKSYLKLSLGDRDQIESAAYNMGYLRTSYNKKGISNEAKKYLDKTPQEQFKGLIDLQIIPEGSKIIDVIYKKRSDGSYYRRDIIYQEPSGERATIQPEGMLKTYDPEKQRKLLEYYGTLTGEKKWLGIKVPKAIEAQMPWYKMQLAPVPIVGTAATWDDMSNGWRAVSVVGDLLTILSPVIVPKVAGMVRGAADSLKSIDYVEDAGRITKALGQYSDEALKRLNPELVSSFKPVSESMETYGEHLVKIKGYQKAITGLETQVREAENIIKSGRITRGSQQYQSLMDAIEEGDNEIARYTDLLIEQQNKAQKAKQVLSKTISRYSDDLIRDLNINSPDNIKSMLGVSKTSDAIMTRNDIIKMLRQELPKDIPEYVESYINSALSSNRTVEEIESELVSARNQLSSAIEKELSKAKGAPEPYKWQSIQAKVTELETELMVVRLGDITKLSGSLSATRDAIKELESVLRNTPKSNPQYQAILETLQAARKAETKLEQSLTKALNWPKLEWQEGGLYGKAGRLPIGTRPSRVGARTINIFGGGMKYRSAELPQLGGVVLVTYTIPGAAGPMRVTKVVPREFPAPRIIEKKGIEIIPVSPQPVWTGQRVITKPKPVIEPWPEVPTKEPEPGEITWTPNIVVVPQISPKVKILYEEWAEPFTRTYAQTQHEMQVQALAKTLINSGVSQKSFNAVMQQTFPISKTKLSEITKTTTEPSTTTAIKSEIKIAPLIQTKPQTQPVMETKTDTETKIDVEKTKAQPVKTRIRMSSGGQLILSKSEMRSVSAWPQGFGWWVTWTADDGTLYEKFFYGQEPPLNFKQVLQGKGEAYRGIQRTGGKGRTRFTKKMGIVDVLVNEPSIRPGRIGAIDFQSLKLPTRNRPRITARRPRIP